MVYIKISNSPIKYNIRSFIDQNNYLEKKYEWRKRVTFQTIYINDNEIHENCDNKNLTKSILILNKKCLTLREETERPITVEFGTNKVIGVNKNIINEINNALNTKIASYEEIELWDGNTSDRIFKDFNGK